MIPSLIVGIYLVLFMTEFLGHWFMANLNMGSVLKNRTEPPESLKEHFESHDYEMNVQYTLRKASFNLYRLVERRLIILAVILGRGPSWLDSWIAGWGWVPYWQAFAFISLASFFLGILNFPGTVYENFVLEEEFGFNNMKPLTFLSDIIKQGLIVGIVLLIFLAGLYGMFAFSKNWWWLLAWAFWMIFQLFATILYPLIIAPLFNKFEPLEDGELKNRLHALADRCSFPNSGIFIMDGSRRSRHSNAYFTGIGRFRRIVLYDTLVKKLKYEELEAVLAHEIGHWKFGHVRRSLILFSLFLLIIFAAVGSLYNIPIFFEAFGFARPSIYGLVFWLIFYAEPLGWFISPLLNILSRRHEYEADRFAVKEIGGKAAPLKGALLTLSKENFSNLSPHPLYSFWNYSHPVLSERLKSLEDSETAV